MADIDFMEYLEAEQIRTRAFIEAHKLLNAGQFKEAARKFIDLSTRMQDIDIDYAAEMFSWLLIAHGARKTGRKL